MQRVAREIKILKRVRHPNVIQLYEVIDTPTAILLVMEHLDGGELFDCACGVASGQCPARARPCCKPPSLLPMHLRRADIVRHGRIREDVAVRFFHDIVDGLSYVHGKEIAHRDLKPVSSRMPAARRTSTTAA